MEYTLSIVILTMNRKEQLLEAFNSCLESMLPERTEFVIVDNGSTDGTGAEIQNLKKSFPKLNVTYKYLKENRGVGAGRSLGFELAQGKYLYFLDDDAVIADECKDKFFLETIDYLERNPAVASVTTRIKDIVLKFDRDVDKASRMIDGCHVVFKYLGGSHFLRKTSFQIPLYFNIQYGSEEYAPSILAQDAGYWHVYKDNIYVIHKPKINKWIAGTDSMEQTMSCGFAVAYATKMILYPEVFKPLLWAAYAMRCWKYLRKYKGAYTRTNLKVKEVLNNNRSSKIKISTVIHFYKEFGLTVF